jgi:beta-lactamase superfamily II metal-dependent hydrolase
MAIKYVGVDKAPLTDARGTKWTLIWGDPVHVEGGSGKATKVIARGIRGTMDSAHLTGKSLLELYVIDVGQGDSVLMKTPGGDWHLIDGGVSLARQMTKKGAANFLRWKFIRDLRRDKVSLKSIVLTHADFDHFGGLIDVMAGTLYDGSRFDIEVENFLHNGLGRFQNKATTRRVGGRRGRCAPLPTVGSEDQCSESSV